MNKLALGTVQFGLNYGINNQSGQIPKSKVKKILEYAFENNITYLDTAYAYGESEIVLGEILTELKKNFKIISKFPEVYDNPEEIFNTSLKRLRTNKLYGYLFHNFNIYKKNPSLQSLFYDLKDKEKVEKIGFSLYYPEELDYILNNNLQIDLIQIPYNIFDRRFEKYFRILKSKNIEIHIRSVFLQGLFFMDTDNLPEYFIPIKDKLIKLQNKAKDLNISIEAFALNLAYKNSFIDKIVIGVDNLENLEYNINAVKSIDRLNIENRIYEDLILNDEKYILPFNWKK